MYISHKQEGSNMFSLLLHLWEYGIAKFLLFLPSVVEHPSWSLGMSFSFLSSGLFPRLSFPSVFFVLFFLSPFAFRLFSPYLCSAGGEARVRLPLFLFLPFPRPSGLPGGSGVPLRVFHPALPAFRVRPFFVSGGPLLRCLPVSSPLPPGMAPCAV